MTARLRPLEKLDRTAPPVTMLRRVTTRGDDRVRTDLPGPEEALDPQTRRSMEPCFGHDLAEVRVHAGPDAALAARTMGAAAFLLELQGSPRVGPAP